MKLDMNEVDILRCWVLVRAIDTESKVLSIWITQPPQNSGLYCSGGPPFIPAYPRLSSLEAFTLYSNSGEDSHETTMRVYYM